MNNEINAGKDNKGSVSLLLFKVKKRTIPIVIFIATLGAFALSGNVSLERFWRDIKQLDETFFLQQQVLIVKLQDEIQNYQKRLDKGQRNLNSDLLTAQRNHTNKLKYLEYWKHLTDDYIFDNIDLAKLESKLSQGNKLVRRAQQEHTPKHIEQGITQLTQVRNAYKQLWAQFKATQHLLRAEEESYSAFKQWNKRKRAYKFDNPWQVNAAVKKEEQAKLSFQERDFVSALNHWQVAKEQWQGAYRTMSEQVASIDIQRAREKAVRDKEIKQAVGEMVSIPSGSFLMGSNETIDEHPIHRVTINAFKISQTEVTFTQWDECVKKKGCTYQPSDSGWGRGNRPVTNISFNDITQQFIPWLNKVTGNTYRLPTEAEWEYAARAGSQLEYIWGNGIHCSQARYGRVERGECSKSRDGSVSVKSFSANSYGLYDMHGNVWEWTQDCFHSNYQGAPSNGSAWKNGDCPINVHVLRGGSWLNEGSYLRLANRAKDTAFKRHYSYGFRLAQ